MQLDMRRCDRAASIVFAALGIAMTVGGYTMERLEIRQIHPASIPGLVPMMLGASLTLLSLLMFAATRRGAADTEAPDEPHDASAWRRLLIAAVLCVAFALGLVGRLPFFVACAIFIFAFAITFTWSAAPSGKAKAAATATALVVALAAAGAISLLFRYGFLVRLP